MSPETRRRVRPWKHLANLAKVAAALQIPIGFWATGGHVEPWALAQVSLWFYAFFAPVDVGLILGSVKDILDRAPKGAA